MVRGCAEKENVMANNFDNPFSANVVGLWDFRDGYTTDDSGLGDGIAQDGTPANGPTFAGGWMLGNGDGARLDVDDGNDAAFDLTEGTIISEFRPYDVPTGDPQTVVSRGLSGTETGGQNSDTDYMEIRVTSDGSVEVYHIDGANSVLLTTDAGFFAGGDVIKVSYAWSEDGVSMTVENTSQGTSYNTGSDTGGLTLDVTEDDEQSFAIGSRETVEGEFDQNFNGAIDYVAVLDEDVVTTNGGLDGIVEGSSGDDLIDLAYTGDPEGDMIDNGDAINPADGPDDDVVNAGAGDDTVEAGAGDDTIYGGSGSDVLNGGDGDDVIEGDTNAPGASPTSRQVFEWDKAPDPDDGGDIDDGDDLSGGFSQDTGSVTVNYSVLNEDSGVETEFTDTTQFVGNVDGDGNPIEDSSGLYSVANGDGNSATYQLEFSDAVENVSFRINDIDGDGVIRITAFDANGDPVVVNLAGGPALSMSDEDAVAGDDTATANGSYANADNPNISVLVTIPGPVSRLVIEHEQHGGGNTGILVSDVYFDVTDAPADIVPGDDTIDGGDGDDIIIAGGGDDVVTGGDGSDSVDGGDGDDFIDTSGGGAIPLPDRGFPGYVGSSVTIPPIPADSDPNDDRDTVDGGDGNDTIMTGDDADLIFGGAGEDSIDGGIDDDTISGGADDDYIVGGEGADNIQGDDGNDTIYGGLDPVFPDVLNIIDDGSGGDPVDPDPTNGMDVIDGGAGDDLIFGQDDDDTLFGGDGNDTLDGGIDNDLIEGGAGDDLIIGGQGADTLFGGDDRDTFLGGTHLDQVDGNEGGDDFDTLDLRGMGPVSVVYTSADEEDGIAIIANTGEVITFKNIETVLTDGPRGTGPDGIVEGSEDGDIIDVLYDGDPNGDFIDNEDALLPGQAPNDDIVIAKGGDDSIISALGDDLIFAGGGNDLVDTDEGDDTVYGGDGDDYIDGREGEDQLYGEDGDDTIVGGDGADLADGGDGDDFIATGSGDDTIYAGDGDDFVDAFTGDDLIFGGAGNDGLVGNDGDDTIDGGEGDDFINAGDGNDEATGGSGDDTLVGGAGDDTLRGGDGDDLFVSGQGNDEMFGDADRDTFYVNPGSDVTGGETGIDEDTLVVNGPAEVEYVGGDPASEAGTVYFLDPAGVRTGETMEFREIETVVIRDLSDLDGVVEGTDSADLIDASYTGDPEGDLIDNLDSLDNLTETDLFAGVPSTFVELLGGPVVGDNRDAVLAGGGDDTVYGGLGDDIIYGGTGNDELIGGFGADDLIGGEGDDLLVGNVGVDRMFGGAGNDTLDGGEQTDLMYGGDGDDLFLGGEGNDSIFGQGGNDTIIGGLGGDTIDGGDGDDSIEGGFGDDVITTGAGSNYVDGGLGNNQIIAGEGNDTLIGGVGDDSIDAGGGDDSIIGGGGNDTIIAGTGFDTIFAGAGDDLVRGGDPSLTGVASVGNTPDLIDGGAGNDTLEGSSGDDTITGGDGEDQIFGGIGADLLEGGDDNDIIYGDSDIAAPPADIEDALILEPGNDTILGGAGDDTVFAQDGNDSVEGGDGDDYLSGGASADTVIGGDGDDTIYGGDDATNFSLAPALEDGLGDVLDGGDGEDVIYGSDYDDTITGGDGGDVLHGGEGEDDINLGSDDSEDVAFGDFGSDVFTGVGQGDNVTGGEDADDLDVDVLDLRGAAEEVNAGGSLSVTYTSGDPEAGVVTFFDAAGVVTGTTDFSEIENVIPCFTPGTLIATPKGERRVEDLKAGDRVITRDNGIQEIRWLGSRDMTRDELAGASHLQPVLICKGALGNGLPERDMMVSPNHRVLVANDKTALYFEDREVLVAAKHLTGLPGVDVIETSSVTYIHFMFDQHEVVLSDGAWTESFQPGDLTLRGLDNAQRNELLELFPELKTEKGQAAYPAARRSLKKHEAHLLVH